MLGCSPFLELTNDENEKVSDSFCFSGTFGWFAHLLQGEVEEHGRRGNPG